MCRSRSRKQPTMPLFPCHLLIIVVVRPDMRYCSRSRCVHPDSGTKHISVPPRHMTKPYAPDFQHDITTLQIQEYNISYNSAYNCLKYNTTAEDTCLSTDYNQMPRGKEKTSIPITI